MENLDFIAIAGVIGALLPLAISLLKQQTWSNQVKKNVAAGAAVVAAIGYTGAREGWEVSSFSDFWSYALTSLTAIYALAQTTYSGFWEDKAIEVRLANSFDRTA